MDKTGDHVYLEKVSNVKKPYALLTIGMIKSGQKKL